jgi:hypothetical protein
LANLLARDQLFTDEIRAEATTLQAHVLEVDGTLSVEALTRRVAKRLGLGPR